MSTVRDWDNDEFDLFQSVNEAACVIESKCHMKISVEEEMRKKMSSLTPRFEKL